MRSQFFRLFLSIILIVFVMSIVEIGVFFFSRRVAEENWKERMFDEFILSISSSLGKKITSSEKEKFTLMDVLDIFSDVASERVSGLLLRDAEGDFVLSLGVSPVGVRMPTPTRKNNDSYAFNLPNRFSPHLEETVDLEKRTIKDPSYELSITTKKGLSLSFRSIETKERSVIELPSDISVRDIAGTIIIKADGFTRAYVDVLVYKMDYYGPTEFALRELIKGLVIFAIPVSLFIAILLAFGVSRRTAKSTAEIQKALGELAAGNFDVSISRQKIQELEDISKSIKALGSDLERHQRARKEWIRNISHDLNTPLASLTLIINGLSDGVFTPDEETIDKMKKEAAVLSERISSVAFYSSLLFPERKLSKEEIRSEDLVREVSLKTKLSFRKEGEITIFGDRVLLERALEEAVKNASSYGENTEVHFKEEKGSVIEIRNKGSLPHPLPQFFEPWARGDSAREKGGSGMGLPIINEIVNFHGGNVTIFEEKENVILRIFIPNRR